MTVPTENNQSLSTADGVQTVFPFDFALLQATDLDVYVNGILQSSGYTVFINDNGVGGTVTFSVAPANGLPVLRERLVSYTQGTALPVEGNLPEQTLESMVDKTVMMIQQLRNIVDGTSVPVISQLLPMPQCRLTPQSGKPFAFSNAAGTQLFVSPCNGNLVPLADSAGTWQPRAFQEIAIPIPTVAFAAYDVFLYWDTNTVSVKAELSAWASSPITGTITGISIANPAVLTSNNSLSGGALIGIVSGSGSVFSDSRRGFGGRVAKVASATGTTITLETGNDSTGLAYTSGGSWVLIGGRDGALSLINGRYVKSTDPTRLFIGSFMTIGDTTGKTQAGAGRELIWNMYNRIPKINTAVETVTGYSYGTATLRARNATISTGNAPSARIEIFSGWPSSLETWEEFLVNIRSTFQATVANQQGAIGIGINSFVPYLNEHLYSVVSQVANQPVNATLPVVSHGIFGGNSFGYKFLQALEVGGGGTNTWNIAITGSNSVMRSVSWH